MDGSVELGRIQGGRETWGIGQRERTTGGRKEQSVRARIESEAFLLKAKEPPICSRIRAVQVDIRAELERCPGGGTIAKDGQHVEP